MFTLNSAGGNISLFTGFSLMGVVELAFWAVKIIADMSRVLMKQGK